MDENDSRRYDAHVPGCIHTDLVRNGVIDDPYFRDNEKHLMWIGEHDWVYEKSFSIPENMESCEEFFLCFDGLDTLAEIFLNGEALGKTDNQFRSWRFPVKHHLKKGEENTVRIVFHETHTYNKKAQNERYLRAVGDNQHRLAGSSRIRKSQCNYGWDWGPMCVTAGIWKPVYLESADQGSIRKLHIDQEHHEDSVNLTIQLFVDLPPDLTSHVPSDAPSDRLSNSNNPVNGLADTSGKLSLLSEVLLNDQLAASFRLNTVKKENTIEIAIDNPQLWWPHDLGDQPLYELRVTLENSHFDKGDNVDQVGKIDKGVKVDKVDEKVRKFGLREIALIQEYDAWGKSFLFSINGVRFFAKGANWIPADTFPSAISDETYRYQLQSSKRAHMNMLRVWGGGIYEADVFYELCDEMGILVWQDLMCACSAYPAYDPKWRENFLLEVRDNIERLRHHPSIILWCGNNEIEQIHEELIGETEGCMTWSEYALIFDDLLGKLVDEIDHQRPYWPSSPHTPIGNRLDANDPKSGDAHLWEVWHGRKPFEWYRTCEHRFVSEFGFQSFPQPDAVNEFTHEKDRNINSRIMDLHQRSPIGNDAIIQYMLSWFQLPKNISMTFWASQILQGLAMKYAIEHWRRSMPRCMGTLYWQQNDCWPAASWSSIDWKGNWKALHYFAARFYAPILISGVESMEHRTCELWITNDTLEAVSGSVHWSIMDTHGTALQIGGGEFGAAGVSPASSGVSLASEATRAPDGSEFSSDGQHTAVPPQTNVLFETISLPERNAEDLLLYIALEKDGITISDDVIVFCRPKHLNLQRPNISWNWKELNDSETENKTDSAADAVSGSNAASGSGSSTSSGSSSGVAGGSGSGAGSGSDQGSDYRVLQLKTEKPALWTWINLPGKVNNHSDNFFHLVPGKPKEISIKISDSELETCDLEIFSLYNCFY